MNTEFQQGFIKRAMQYGLSEKQASNFLGRYGEMHKQKAQNEINHPYGTTAQRLGGVAGGLVGDSAGAMLYNRFAMGKGPKERRKGYEAVNDELDNTGYGQAALKGAKSFAAPGAILGGAAYPLLAHLLGGENGPHDFKDYAGLAGIGAASGGLGGAIGGGILGAASKGVHESTGDESKDRANKMLAKHPYATELPFGRLVGSMFA